VILGNARLEPVFSFERFKLLLHVADADEVALLELRKSVGILAAQWWKAECVIALVGV